MKKHNLFALLKVDTHFESGNFVIHEIAGDRVVGEICKDTNNKDFQWFYFSIAGKKDQKVEIKINNVDLASYADAWNGYQICVNHGGDGHWQRVDVVYRGGALNFSVVLEKQKIFIAYFQPYCLSQHKILSKQFMSLPMFYNKRSVSTIKNHEVELFHLRNNKKDKNRKNVWIIARQHPGESIVGWFMEGIVNFFSAHKALASRLLAKYQFLIIHNMNPDGVFCGAHRTNAVGLDLNRNWSDPHLTQCAEVIAVRQWMDQYPPYLFFDIHGDEKTSHPYALVNQKSITSQYNNLLKRLYHFNPDLEIRPQQLQEVNLSIGRHFVNNRFNCFALTLEMPCQYYVNTSIDKTGDLVERAKKLAYGFMCALS